MPRHAYQFLAATMTGLAEAVRWTAAGILIGATGGVLFAIFWGTVLILMEGATWRTLSVGLYLAACGAIAGALLGACRGTFDRRGSHVRSKSSDKPPRSGAT